MTSSQSGPYQVYVDDNFHYMDESERYLEGSYADCSTARQHCIAITERALQEVYVPGMDAQTLWKLYVSFGEDPWISDPNGECKFSAWEYASRRVKELCQMGKGTKATDEGG